MQSTLYQLYKGELHPLEHYTSLLKEYQDLLKKHHLRYDHLEGELEKINPQLKQHLVRLLDEQFEEIYWETAQMFIDGFCLGAKIMVEVYQKDFTSGKTD